MFRLTAILLILPSFAFAQAATGPVPIDDRQWIDPALVRLHWTAGTGHASPIDHFVVFLDDDPAVINNPDGVAEFSGTVDADDPPTFDVTSLALATDYHWRVDTILEDTTRVVGDAWSFQTERVDLPGVAVNYSPDPAEVYLMSPSIAPREGGGYIVSHDVSGPGPPAGSLTQLWESTDGGVNWTWLADVPGLHWANLFWYEGDLYLFGVAAGQRAAIYRSEDGGKTWTTPVDENTGYIFPDAGYHTGPMPVVEHGGRVWRAIEDLKDPGDWPEYFRAMMISAPVGSDLLAASNWTATNRLSYDETMLPGAGWLEGNAVVTPDGGIVNMLRLNSETPSFFLVETAAMVHVSADGTTATFDPASGFIDFPGGGVKFVIRYDETSGRYWSLVNKQRDPWAMRNVLAISSSPDLIEWTVHDELIAHWNWIFHGWHYTDWLIEGEDIVFASRTAHPMGDALPHGYHDANFTTFHRVENFRDYLQTGDDDDDSVDDDADDDDAADDDSADDDDAADDDADDDATDDDDSDGNVDDDADDDAMDDDAIDDDASADDDSTTDDDTTNVGAAGADDDDSSCCGC
ncbi:hypothetical protein K8I61_02425 [bacterium]|nr:hypothetical protein [bacterium]